ncbi:MAG: hypothetical protein IPN77_30750 [Sandaracinaceae bacterium]|nr:hypothetical protein [Sandaracinaceae bacterium]
MKNGDPNARFGLAEFVQVSEAAVNDVVPLAPPSSSSSRWSAAPSAPGSSPPCSSWIARHLVDVHQLTKNPDALEATYETTEILAGAAPDGLRDEPPPTTLRTGDAEPHRQDRRA